MKPPLGPLSDPSLQSSSVSNTLLLQDFPCDAVVGSVGLVWFCFGVFVSSSSIERFIVRFEARPPWATLVGIPGQKRL